MSFRESEFPDLLENILKVGEQYGDSSLTFEVVKKVVELVKQIPLYPGIVGMCLAKYVEEVGIEKLNPGDKIFLKTETDGSVAFFNGLAGDEVRIRDGSSQERRIEKNKIKKILRFREDILREIWPTLVFDEKGEK
jgi:hypothetical protein